MKKYFGTDGIRGIAQEELSAEMAFKIGEYLGYTFKGKKVVIGTDTRVSKDMLEAGLIAGLTSTGANVYTLKVVPTPCVSYFVKKDDFACGIVVSASHNPYYDNGIKIFNDQGEKISAELEAEIEKYLAGENTVKHAKKDTIGVVVDYRAHIQEYLDFLAQTIEETDLSKYHLLVDTANGAASYLAGDLFSQLNVEATIINKQPDGYNINQAAGSTHLETIKEAITEGKYDLGLAYDGDADRLQAITKEGETLDGDLILYICGTYLKEKKQLKKDTVVTTVMSNIGLYKAFDKEGIKYIKTDVGDKYVYEAMQAEDYSLGGEQSGHIIFKDYATTGDGLLSSLKLLEAIDHLGGLDNILERITIYPQRLENVKVKDKNAVLENADLQKKIQSIEKELKGEGRVLIRPSGTEPLVRVMVEAGTEELCQKYVSELVKTIETI